MDFRATRLKGGTVVATAEMPHVRSVSVGIWAGTGARHEAARVSGISHFLEHMLFKGTRRRSAREISEAIEGVGGYLNAFTGEDHTCYYARVGGDRFDLALEVLGDMMTGSVFAPDEIARERQVIREEILSYRDQPAQLVLEKLALAAWPGHALGRAVTGTPETVDRITRADLLRHHRRVSAAGGVLFTAAGAVEHEQVVRAVERVARRLPAGAPPSASPARRAGRPAIVAHADAIEQSHIALGFRLFGRRDPRRYALRLLNLVLGENMSSRLFQELRERRGLCYSIQSGSSLLSDTGILSIQCALDPTNSARAVRLMLRECHRLARTRLGSAELRRARDAAIGQAQLALESPGSRMSWLGEAWLGYGRLVDPIEVERRFEAVTADEIRATAAEIFRRERIALAVVAPEVTVEQARGWLA
jgi:predicted Zn-dependent peptidase